MRVVILGSGTSMGVPIPGCTCAVCQSEDPRDARTRVAAWVETEGGSSILIDTPPELRLQLVRAGVGRIDAVLFTHDHADHVHGIDDLRPLTNRNGELNLYGPAESLGRIRRRFDYIFDEQVVPVKGTSKPDLRLVPVGPERPVRVADVDVRPILVSHGVMDVYGYRIGDFAYVTDVKAVSPDAVDALRGVNVLVLSALFEKPHPTHLSIPEAIEVAQAIGAERTLLTHLTHRYSHRDLLERLPAGIEPAYDGLTLTI